MDERQMGGESRKRLTQSVGPRTVGGGRLRGQPLMHRGQYEARVRVEVRDSSPAGTPCG